MPPPSMIVRQSYSLKTWNRFAWHKNDEPWTGNIITAYPAHVMLYYEYLKHWCSMQGFNFGQTAEVRYPLEPLLPKMHGRKVLRCNLWAQLRPVPWRWRLEHRFCLYVFWSGDSRAKQKEHMNIWYTIYIYNIYIFNYQWYYV